MSKVLAEVSARHVHLSRRDMDALFGLGSELTFKRALSQPGQFSCEERVDVIGPKRELKGVAVLGPLRADTQVELSLTDARAIGVDAPIRESGRVSGSGACTIVGPAGAVDLAEGVVAAKRHIHLDPATAAQFGLVDQQIVSVRLDTPERALVLGDVEVRVRDDFAPALHIDTDEGNAAGILNSEAYGEILK